MVSFHLLKRVEVANTYIDNKQGDIRHDTNPKKIVDRAAQISGERAPKAQKRHCDAQPVIQTVPHARETHPANIRVTPIRPVILAKEHHQPSNAVCHYNRGKQCPLAMTHKPAHHQMCKGIGNKWQG